MNDSTIKIKALAEGLAVGESRREDGFCYFCNGGTNHDRGTLRVTQELGHIWWICFRTKCGSKGILGSPPLQVQAADAALLRQKLRFYDKPLENLRFQTYANSPVANSGKTLRDYFSFGQCRIQRWRVGIQDARLIMPVIDFRGLTIGHSARAFGRKVEIRTLLYREHDTPMLHFPIQSQELGYRVSTLVLTEDIFSSVKVSSAIPAAACLGTTFTRAMADILLQINVQRLLFMFDGDEAGIQAAVRASRRANSLGLVASVLPCPMGFDPKDLSPLTIEKLIAAHMSPLG